jgi:hypothetical protein
MSKASVWADAMAVEDISSNTQEGLKPPGFGLEDASQTVYFSALVTHDGGLQIETGALLSADEALALGQWIITTFQA